ETNDWSRVAPVLEEALSELADPDRDAVVLRFFEDEPYARIGSALECSEDAARMRVDRALDRLRAALEKRGVTSTSGALAALILANAVIPAPTGMAASISAGACAVPAGSGAAHLLASKPLVFGFATAVLVGVLTLGWVGDRLRTGQLRLAQANAALRAELESLRSSIPQSTSAADLAELERLRREHDELLRLRGEVARLRREQASHPNVAAAPAPPENGAPEESDPPEQFTVEAKFLEVTDRELETLNLKWLNSGATGMMVPEEYKRIQDLVRRLPGIEVLAAPNVTTLGGRQARISMGAERDAPDQDGSSGEELALDVIPVLDKTTGLIELSLRGGRMPRLQPFPGDGKGGGNVAIPRKAPPFATTSVHDGWGFVLRRPGIPSSSETPRSLLILGTVVQIDPAGNRVFPPTAEK
ncbi:MAG: sigma-70 family RNA polymerase sigma factor, partial [Verrucomicrobiales bacterium]|nr:sigma-70 family RNA polymerase sigma factor [Verrucomicrobiales bacterium]